MNNIDIVRDEIIRVVSESIDSDEGDIDLAGTLFAGKTGLRLSSEGNKILSKIFTSYPFVEEIELLKLPAKHYIAMGKFFDYPYYIGKKRIVLYSQPDATALNMYGGIEQFLDALASGITIKNS